jgi:hypothetical protein
MSRGFQTWEARQLAPQRGRFDAAGGRVFLLRTCYSLPRTFQLRKYRGPSPRKAPLLENREKWATCLVFVLLHGNRLEFLSYPFLEGIHVLLSAEEILY